MQTLVKIPKAKWLIIFLLPLICALLHLILRPEPTENPILISHRGAAGLAPENTLAAVRTGIDQNTNSIEIDVRRSADGVLLLMHESQVEKTTNGTGVVADLTWSEISQLDAGSHFSAAFAGEPVPSLEAVLELSQNSPIIMMLEVKEPKLYPGLEHQLVEVITQFEMQDRVTVISFDHDWIEDFHKLAPQIPVSVLSYWPLRPPQVSAAEMVSVVWPAVLLDPTLVRRMHNRGHLVIVFTVNNPQIIRWLLWLGVNGIITDRPDVWNAAIK